MRLTPVDAPPAAAPRVSILTGAQLPDDAERWQNGITYSSEACPGVVLADPCGPDTVTVVEPGDPDDTEVRPVYATTLYRCTARGVRGEYAARARRALDLATPYAIERELATGELAAAAAVAGGYDDTNPRLQAGADVTDLTPAGGAVPPARALALLENALGDLLRGGQGTIHARRGAAAILPNVTRDGNVLSTRVGTRVIAGAGYPGAGPDGTPSADGETWLYGTGLTSVRLYAPELPSDNDVAATLRREVNQVEIMARRLFAASFDGCALVAVRMAYPAAT